jgi:hypothetical protein
MMGRGRSNGRFHHLSIIIQRRRKTIEIIFVKNNKNLYDKTKLKNKKKIFLRQYLNLLA